MTGSGFRMRGVGRGSALAVTVLLALTACQADDAQPSSTPTTERTPDASPSLAGSVPSAGDFDPGSFSDPTTVDNTWFPLVPGTQMTWEGHALEGKTKVDRKVVFTVTDLVKQVAGVQVVVGWDLDYNDGVLEEAEIAFFAQDDDGNVWHFGQYPEEYEDGQIVKTPVWIAGYRGARAGIAMKGHPDLGAPSYAQGWGPQWGWNDRAKAYRMGVRTCSAIDCYGDVLVTKEFSRTEPGAYQLKYYAPGIGNVRVGWGGPSEEEQEVLLLTDLVHLDDDALAEVRDKVLAQEGRAYEISPKIYGRTEPSQIAP